MMDARMTDLAPTRTTVSLTLNGRTVEAQKGELIITAAENAGTYIPRFCYHPRMEPVAFCRMCLVEVEGPRGATLQPSCFVAVAEGMVVNTESEKVKKAQDGVLEFLLANHPLDCPVCDKGGECPLQDQTLAHGSGETRFVEEKRHFAKPIGIGELVLLDRERCIQCARCTRFAAEVAGDPQIDFAGRGDEIEVAPFPTEPFDSVFSGNTVQICPVGALTAKPYRFSARPWDLEQVESTCTTCAVGCREAVQSAGGRLSRVLGIDSDPVNHGWLCDKGRFTIEAVQSEIATGDILDSATRITEPMVRRGDAFESVGWGEALAEAASILKMAREQSPNNVGAMVAPPSRTKVRLPGSVSYVASLVRKTSTRNMAMALILSCCRHFPKQQLTKPPRRAPWLCCPVIFEKNCPFSSCDFEREPLRVRRQLWNSLRERVQFVDFLKSRSRPVRAKPTS